MKNISLSISDILHIGLSGSIFLIVSKDFQNIEDFNVMGFRRFTIRTLGMQRTQYIMQESNIIRYEDGTICPEGATKTNERRFKVQYILKTL